MPGEPVVTTTLSPDLAAGHRPQATVPAGAWQSAVSTGPFTLVGCTVAPAFEFAGFELAPPGWEPGVIRFPGARDVAARPISADHERREEDPMPNTAVTPDRIVPLAADGSLG